MPSWPFLENTEYASAKVTLLFTDSGIMEKTDAAPGSWLTKARMAEVSRTRGLIAFTCRFRPFLG